MALPGSRFSQSLRNANELSQVIGRVGMVKSVAWTGDNNCLKTLSWRIGLKIDSTTLYRIAETFWRGSIGR